MKSLSGPVNSVLVAGTFIVAFEAFAVAELGAREALWRGWLLGSGRQCSQ